MPVSCLTSFLLQKAHITFQILVRRNLEKLEYIKQATGARINLQFEQIPFIIWTNTFYNWYKYIEYIEILECTKPGSGDRINLQNGKLLFPYLTNTLCNLGNYIRQFGQIHLARAKPGKIGTHKTRNRR